MRFLRPDAHPGYISWEQFWPTKPFASKPSGPWGGERLAGRTREGPALLQGLVLCAKCGRSMTFVITIAEDDPVRITSVNRSVEQAKPVASIFQGLALMKRSCPFGRECQSAALEVA